MWEYKVHNYHNYMEGSEDLATFLSRHSQDGWELASFMPAHWVGEDSGMAEEAVMGDSDILVVFRRERRYRRQYHNST